LLEEINEERRQKLGVDTLRPWDLAVDADGRTLKPFSDTDGLLSGALRVLSRVDPEFSEIIRALSEKGLLDLPNRKGKAPGGYCTSLFETGGSFIFMNAVGIQYDVQTLLHESGHSIHSYFKKEEKISEYKDTPSEVAELASMSMELMTVEHYGEFYGNPEDLRKAKRELLEGTLTLLPLVAVVDAFQHGAYLHPESSAVERDGEYARLKERFNAGVDWTGLEKEKEIGWLKTMHIFELPFYYIEYGLAQLGAIALYKQYKQDPEKAVFRYKESMKLGYSKPVPEIYATAGIRFDFSAEHLREMAAFIVDELAKLEGASSARS
jgi:oligoendopeptidase F